MKQAVMYGAGNIGRGFIGKTLSESGYEVCFLDIVPEVIEAFNKDHEYRVRVVSNEGERLDTVGNVRAVNANTEEAIKTIAACDIMASAVGVNVLPHIAENIAKGMRLRMKESGRPLDIILAENQLDADKIMRGYIYQYLNEDEKKWADENLGLVEASIGRMVPPLSPEDRAGDPLLIAVEPYCQLPVDREAFRGGIPDLKGLVPYAPFSFYIRRKLFVHNMGHAVCAYLGWLKGYEYIYEAVADDAIKNTAQAAMDGSAAALSKEYGVPENELKEHVRDLLFRFGNKALRDTTVRVGADPVRKLRRDDRLVGAALYCMEQGIDPENIVVGIAAALRFAPEGDKAAAGIQTALKTDGLDAVIETYMGIPASGELARLIRKEMA
ncbi:mannitol dehydrogenase family protein [Christensenella intestinihominis]|uniref:mannitol dehydrogenase family protein n=1 Tax=Christensenella intestinihominis TaxID=1851429 RepID=UPI00082AF34A|nr:hypothetical protein [Christensenella intestinihominis]